MVLRLTSSVAVLLAVFGVLMFAAVNQSRAESVYYAGINNNGTSYTFGTVNSAGQTTVIGTGLGFGGAGAEKLMFAPNGDLYGFDVGYAGGSGAWGRINPATGAFTQIGNLNTYFPNAIDHTETDGFSLAFGPSGILYATGWDGNFERQNGIRDTEPDNRGFHRDRCFPSVMGWLDGCMG